MNDIITPINQDKWPLLEMPSRPCSIPITPEEEEIILLMDQKLNELKDKAIGIAAVQVGFPYRMFLLNKGKENNVYINPIILKQSSNVQTRRESCLSLPHLDFKIKRPKQTTLQFFDIDGNLQTEKFVGQWSRAVCHEMDHLDGKLVIHRAINPNQSKRTRFGMKLDAHRVKVIKNRRKSNKKARKARKQQRT